MFVEDGSGVAILSSPQNQPQKYHIYYIIGKHRVGILDDYVKIVMREIFLRSFFRKTLVNSFQN